MIPPTIVHDPLLKLVCEISPTLYTQASLIGLYLKIFEDLMWHRFGLSMHLNKKLQQLQEIITLIQLHDNFRPP